MLKWTIFLVIFIVVHSLEVKIVAPYKKGPEPCALICAGTTGIGTTAWENRGDHIAVTVDMSECGFVSPPIVSTVVTGDGMTRALTGTGGVYALSSTKFKLIPTRTFEYDLSKTAKDLKWRVDWQAVGYVC
jgi:hypothetical protein